MVLGNNIKGKIMHQADTIKNAVHYEYIGNYTLVVNYDEFFYNPRHERDLTTFRMALAPHHDHLINCEQGDISYSRTYDRCGYITPADDWADLLKNYLKGRDSQYIAFPILKYEHGNISLSLTSMHDTADAWDYAIFGFVFAKKSDIAKEFNQKRFSKKLLEKAKDIAKADLRELEQYINNVCYRYDIYQGHLTETDYLPNMIYRDSCSQFLDEQDAIADGRYLAGLYDEQDMRKTA